MFGDEHVSFPTSSIVGMRPASIQAATARLIQIISPRRGLVTP